MKNKFRRKFGSYVCDGDSITASVKGYDVTARIVRDEDMGPPWKEHDGHGPVSDWTSRAKRAGELVLNEDRGSRRYYDFAEAVKIAKRDGWGPGAPHEAARKDFEAMRAWCNDEWWWVGIVLSVSRNGVELSDHAASLWGIDANHPQGNNDYLTEIANELLPEALKEAEKLRALVSA